MVISDEDITPMDTRDTPQVAMQGPITRARARQLNLQVSSFLSTSLCDIENRLLPNDVIIPRNHGEDQEVIGERQGGGEEQQGRPTQVGGPTHIEFESISESKSSLH